MCNDVDFFWHCAVHIREKHDRGRSEIEEGNACFVLFLQSGRKINNVDEFKYVPFISPLIQLLGLKSGKQK